MKKIEMSDVQSPIVVETSHSVEKEEECQQFNYHCLIEDDVEREYKCKNLAASASGKVGRIGSHSKHFSTLCLDDDMYFESSELVEDCVDEEQESYILKFAPDKQQNNMPHLRAKRFNMYHPALGPFICAPPPYEQSKKMDAMLGVKFISSRWRKKLMVRATTLN